MYNIVRLLALMLSLLLLLLPLHGCSNGRRSCRYLIPSGYVGFVRIDYGVSGAPSLPLEQGFLLFRIPSTGYLQTSTAFVGGRVEDEFYYVTGNQRQQVHGESDGYPTGSQPPIPMVWGRLVGGGRAESVYEMFFIGTKKQYEEFGKKHRNSVEFPDIPLR